MNYGQEFDFSQEFFPQFKKLLERVPHQGQFIVGGTLINSDYVNCAGYLKDCYLIAETDYNESCYYGNRIFHCKGIVDSSNCYQSEWCYECVDIIECYNLAYSDNCKNCSDSFFLRSCIGCHDSIGCINQRQKSYMIFNEQLDKDEYEKRKADLKLNSHEGIQAMRDQVERFFLTQPQKAVQNEHNENATGNHLYDSKNAFDCVDCKDLEDCKWCARVFSAKSSRDYTSWGDRSELMYQCAACGDNCYNLMFCTTCTTNNTNLIYCAHCASSSDCFGCVGVRKKKYCIFNKQYSQSAYESLKERIIAHMKKTGEWGEFFPKNFCPFGFNETIAYEYFPLTKEQALKLDFQWHDDRDEIPQVPTVIEGKDIPETIHEVPNDVLQWAIRSMHSSRPFRILKQELDFYRQHDIPLPRLHPDERHARRMLLRPYGLHERTCDKCSKDIFSIFRPDRPEIVYCEECYLKAVY
jgi:hypothetical protein